MKQIIKLLLSMAAPVTALALAGCSQALEPENPDSGQFVLRAELPEDQEVVKTALNGYEVVWKTGDVISVNGVKSNAVASADDGKRCLDFTFGSTPSSPYNTLYPGTTSKNTVTFPATQKYVENSFDNGAAPSYGVATTVGGIAGVSLKPLATVLRFALNGSSTITKIVLNNRGSEKICGNYTVNFSTGAITASGSNGTTITYNIGTKALGGTDTYFYIAIPAGTYASGLEALIYEQTTEKYMRLTFGKGVTYEAGSLIEFVSVPYAPGRVEELASITDFEAEDGGTPKTQDPGFTVATYNILSDVEGGRSSSGGKLYLDNCGTQLGVCVERTQADIICFNEIDETFATSSTQSIQKLAEAQGLTGYSWYITNPNKVTHEWMSYDKEYTYANGYAYDPDVFECVSQDYFWYNKNGGYVSTKDDAYDSHLDKYRTIIWAKLTHKRSNKTFNLMVTHMPNKDDGNSSGELAEGVAHSYAATAINKFMTDKDSSGPWLLCGDLNAYGSTSTKTDPNNAGYTTLKTKWTDAYEYMVDQGTISDFYQKYVGTQSGTGTSYQYDVLTFTKNHPERRIDHIMMRGFKAESYKTIRLTYQYGDNNVCPSDHLPVVAYVSFN